MGGLRGLRRIPPRCIHGERLCFACATGFPGAGLAEGGVGWGVECVSPQDSVSLPVCQLFQ